MKPKKDKKPTPTQLEAQAQHDKARTRMLDAFDNPDNTPSVRARAGFEYRRDGMVATGYDRLNGAAGTYHLTTDFATPVVSLCRTLAGADDYAGCGTPRAKAEAVIAGLDFRVGYRWHRGAENLELLLHERGVATLLLTTYVGERRATGARLLRLLDATEALLQEGQPETALLNARTTLAAAAEEVGRLAYWLELAGDPYRAAEAREAYGNALHALAEFDAARGTKKARKRSGGT